MIMFGIIGLFAGLAFVLALTLGVAFILDIMMPSTPWKTRALWAALIAAFLPMSLPIVSVLAAGGWTTEGFVALGGLVIGALFIAAVVCFPVAYFFSKKRAAARPDPGTAKDFD